MVYHLFADSIGLLSGQDKQAFDKLSVHACKAKNTALLLKYKYISFRQCGFHSRMQ